MRAIMRASGHAFGILHLDLFYSMEFLMAYVITEPCLDCKDTACAQVCPCDCIHPLKDELGFASSKQLFIDPDNCIDCGLCVDECPPKAIYLDDEVPSKWKHYIQLNADHFKSNA